MSLDKIVVLILALGFFGGIAFVYWKSRQEERKGGQSSSPGGPDTIEGETPKKSQEKERKTSKS